MRERIIVLDANNRATTSSNAPIERRMTRKVEQERNINLAFGSATKSSGKHPERNDDNKLIMVEGAIGIYDGLGSRKGSDVVAELAAEKTREAFKKHMSQISSKENAEAMVKGALNWVNKKLLDRNYNIHKKNMREYALTTAAIGFFWQDNKGDAYFTCGHSGDSRLYLFRDKELTPLTLDHSKLRENKLKEGLTIDEIINLQSKLDSCTDLGGLTDEEISLIDGKHIVTQSLGYPSIKPDSMTIKVKDGDRFIGVTDGISDPLTPDQMRFIVEDNQDVQAAADALVDWADKAGKISDYCRAKDDDKTVVIVKYEKPKLEDEAEYLKREDSKIEHNEEDSTVFSWSWVKNKLIS